MSNLFFAQQHIYTQLGHTVNLLDTPHYKLLSENDIDGYKNYLKESWKYYFPNIRGIEGRINRKLTEYKNLLEDIRVKGIQQPISVFKRVNGDLMVLDGNHRACIGLYLGIKIPFKVLTLKEAMEKITTNPLIFYGSMNKGIPYQSIYSPMGELYLRGRRDDLPERNELIDEADVLNKSVLDLGCNYGNSLMMVNGAKKLIGIDISPQVLTSAVRLSVIFQKDIQFVCHDLNKFFALEEDIDTAFIFSITSHLRTLEGLVYFIENQLKKVLYFETHEHGEIPEQIKKLFSKCELKGKNEHNRKLYRLEK